MEELFLNKRINAVFMGLNMDILVIKLGGSALTNKDEKFSFKREKIKKIGQELSSIEEKFILVHGGGSFGHPVASKYDIANGYHEREQLLGFSKTHNAMEKLNQKIISILIDVGIPAVPVQTSLCSIVENGELVSMDLKKVESFLDLGLVPVLYGDSVLDGKKDMNILSGDQILAYLAEEFRAKQVIVGMDSDGVYTKDPKTNEDAELIPKITPESWENISSLVEFPTGEDVTGGIKNKVKVLIDLAKKGIESQIINIENPKNISKAIRSDKKVGTKISKE